MRKYALFGLIGFASCLTLASCGNNDTPTKHQHSFSTNWSSDETSHWHACECGEKADIGTHAFNAGGFCSVCNYFSESKNFTEEKLGYLSGEFYAYDYVLNVSKDGATLTNGDGVISLTNEKIEGTKYSTKVSYKGSDKCDYILSWKTAKWDVHEIGYMLPTLEVVGKNTDMQFQPSIESIQGWYDGWEGEINKSNTIYIIQNDFDSLANMYQMYICSGSFEYLGKGYHIASSFIDVDGETHIGLSWFDNQDLEAGYNYEEWNYWVKVNKNNNRLYMMWFDNGGAAWWSRPNMFALNFWKDEYTELGLDAFYESGFYFSNIDEVAETVCIEDGEPVSYETCLDELGSYYKIGDMVIRGTRTGMTITQSDEVMDYIPFFTADLVDLQYSKYLDGENSIEYSLDWDSWVDAIFVNDEMADTSSIIRYGDKLAYKATKGDNVYIITPFYETDAIKVFANNEEKIYFYEYLSYEYEGSFITDDNKLLEIDTDLNITLDGELIAQATFGYNAEWDIITVNFEGHQIFIANDERGLFLDLQESGLKMLLAEDVANSIFGDWSNGKISLSIEPEKVTYNGKEYAFDGYELLINNYNELVPVAKFNDAEESYFFTFDASGLGLYNYSNMEFVSSFIEEDYFSYIVGEYIYLGEYGEEKVAFTNDGRLFVDVLKDDKSGVETKEFDYNPFISVDDECIGLEFEFKGVQVDILFDGRGHASIFDINYTLEAFANHQGLFGTTSDQVFFVNDTRAVYNGNELYVESTEENVFNCTMNDTDSVKVTFDENGVTIVVNEEAPIALEKNPIQLEDFITPVHENVGNLSRDIKVTEQGIFIRITGGSEFKQVTDFEYKIDESGNVSIEFFDSVVYKFTISINEGVVEVKGESSLPPLPPLPPVLP